MRWPNPSDYSDAMQNPRSNLCVPYLREGRVEADCHAMPKTITGNFAMVFRWHAPLGGGRAIRCFLRAPQDIQRRYEAITQLCTLRQVDRPACLKRFAYQEEGIRVGHYGVLPLVEMDWVEGRNLDTYIESIAGDREKLNLLIVRFQKLIRSLVSFGIAHGDLQHGNILVSNEALHLVDYDGMFIPELRTKPAMEIGLPAYQHPRRRPEDYSDRVDNFSALVIATTLVALRETPELWHQFHLSDDQLIFTRSDFESPDQSPLFCLLRRRDTQAGALANTLAKSCRGHVQDVPRLDEILGDVPRLPGWMRNEIPAGAMGRLEPLPDMPSHTASARTPDVEPQSPIAFEWDSRGWGDMHPPFATPGWMASHTSGSTAPPSSRTPPPAKLSPLSKGSPSEDAIKAAMAKYLPAKLSPLSNASPWPSSASASAASQTSRRLVGNMKSGVLHHENCEWAPKINPRNRRIFASVSEAQQAGMRSCRNCFP